MSSSRRKERHENEALAKALRGEVSFDVEDEPIEEEKKSAEGEMTRSPEHDDVDDDVDISTPGESIASVEDMHERAKYIPLRLTYEERKSLRLVNAAINVSDYTNSVDIDFKSKSKRRHVQLQNICGFLSGVIAASRYDSGQRVLEDRNFHDHQDFLQVNSLPTGH
jgi:hypothetical protein